MCSEWFAHPRRMLLGFSCICLTVFGIAVLMGEVFGLEACAMCWFQRLALVVAAQGFLLAAFWPATNVITQRLGELGLILGFASACRQVYLLCNPSAASGSCGAGLMYYLSIGDYEGFFRAGMVGGIECATEQASIWGIELPLWSLAAFTGIGLMYLSWQILGLKSTKKSTR